MSARLFGRIHGSSSRKSRAALGALAGRPSRFPTCARSNKALHPTRGPIIAVNDRNQKRSQAMAKPEYQNLTVVLVHAAWADASSWDKVTPRLRELGLSVRSAQIPLSSLSEDIAALKRLLRQVDGPMLLVGHSY